VAPRYSRREHHVSDNPDGQPALPFLQFADESALDDESSSTKSQSDTPSALVDTTPLSSADSTVNLNKSKMLECLAKIENENSVISLRTQIARLTRMLDSATSDRIGLLNITANGDTITLTQQYILAELNQIAESQTLERARYYIDRLEKALTEVRTNEVNDINLNRWKEYEDITTDSLWVIEKRDSSGAHTAGYWGNFIPQIPNQMIKRYTKQGEWVLDTFAGCGTTLIESQRLGRNGIGIELQPNVASRARELIGAERNKFGVVSEVVNGDSSIVDYRSILQQHGQKSVQLLVMHPPYFDIIKFSDDPRDLSNAPSVESFLEMMNRIVDRASSLLDKGRYFVLVIGDKYAKGEWIPLGFLTMNEIMKRGFALKSIIVKNFEDTTAKRNQKELWRYRALVGGFYIFKHEYVFLFRKK